jgi:predicted nucleic acid-binding protein
LKLFIDSNIPMYVAGTSHPNREPAVRLLESVREGRIEACTSTEVLQEILWRYSAIGRLDLAENVYNLCVQVVHEVFDVTLADTDLARDLLTTTGGLSARDAVHAAVMLNRGVTSIATFDRGFERVGRVTIHALA